MFCRTCFAPLRLIFWFRANGIDQHFDAVRVRTRVLEFLLPAPAHTRLVTSWSDLHCGRFFAAQGGNDDIEMQGKPLRERGEQAIKLQAQSIESKSTPAHNGGPKKSRGPRP